MNALMANLLLMRQTADRLGYLNLIISYSIEMALLAKGREGYSLFD